MKIRSKDEDDLFCRNLEISDVCIRQEGVLLVWVEQAEVLHDDGDQEVEHDVGNDHVEAAEEHDGGHEVAAIYLRKKKWKSILFYLLAKFLWKAGLNHH